MSLNLTFLLERFLREHPLGRLRVAPSDVLLTEHDTVQPDLYVLLEAHYGRVHPRGCEGAPDLVVEILSPGNAAHDLVRKFGRYELAGVAEYWVVDPEVARVEVYRRPRGPDGQAARFARPVLLEAARDDVLETPLLPGFAAPLREVFDPGPAPATR